VRIACLGWGSLVWNPRELRIAGGRNAWNNDGPYLPVEFARQSQCDRVTLVLLRQGPLAQTLWAEMLDDDLEAARSSLALREGTPGNKPIGVWPSQERYPHVETIAAWAVTKGLEGVVWTALGPKFNKKNGRIPTADEVVTYLRRLVEDRTSTCAEEYIRRTPPQVRTPYRTAIEENLGWTPVS